MTKSISNIQTQHLVLTAIGKDKTGLVSELTGLVNECHCNILDSKMALFGSEFSMIMLLAGDGPSLSQLEMRLPQLAMQLNLLTMMKRTTAHNEANKPQFVLQLEGPDQAGTIKTLTSYLAENAVLVRSLKSATRKVEQQDWQSAEIVIELNDSTELMSFSQGFEKVCHSLEMKCSFKPITIE